MKGKYLYYTVINPEKATGIQKKILSQLEVMNRCGNQCELYYLKSKKTSKFRFFLQNIPVIGNKYSKWTYDNTFSSLDYLYIRRPSVFDSAFVKYIRKIKYDNPEIKIIVEIPTYPYDAEYIGIVGRFTLVIDKIYRKKLEGLIDAFAVVAWNSTEDFLWGVPVLPISNGIDLDKISKLDRSTHKKNKINLLCIAYFSPWHGYEKIIESLGYYYRLNPTCEVNLHIVGTGTELDKYKDLVRKNSLEDKVIFYNEINNEIDNIYNKCDIGVCSINSKHFGVFLSSQLKSREYLAKGLPIITCGDIDILQSHYFPYELIVDYDRRIDFNRIVEFYESKIMPNPQKVTDKIRDFAEKNCGWDAAMKSVLDFLGF